MVKVIFSHPWLIVTRVTKYDLYLDCCNKFNNSAEFNLSSQCQTLFMVPDTLFVIKRDKFQSNTVSFIRLCPML